MTGIKRSLAKSSFDRTHTYNVMLGAQEILSRTSCLLFIETVRLFVPFSRYVANYLSKVANFSYPTFIWRPCWGWPHLNFYQDLGQQKLLNYYINCKVISSEAIRPTLPNIALADR